MHKCPTPNLTDDRPNVKELGGSVYTFGITFQSRDSGLKKLIPGSIPGFSGLEIVQN